MTAAFVATQDSRADCSNPRRCSPTRRRTCCCTSTGTPMAPAAPAPTSPRARPKPRRSRISSVLSSASPAPTPRSSISSPTAARRHAGQQPRAHSRHRTAAHYRTRHDFLRVPAGSWLTGLGQTRSPPDALPGRASAERSHAGRVCPRSSPATLLRTARLCRTIRRRSA